ncbi:MAG: hypothetical protein K2M55_08595, partial [Muribaculaceae bacterium]|nr:hypothetical protein [Muribaculaceae bacterium]
AYDRGFYDDIEDFDFSTPTLISVNTDNTISKLSVFDGHIENAYGAGVAVSEVGDRVVMFYGTGYQPATYAIATLPDYPVSIVRSELVRTFGAGELSVGNERRYALAAPNKGQVVHTVRVDDNTSRFYTMTDNNSLACVQVSGAGSGDVVRIAVDDSGRTEYFDLNGRPCTHPASPGVYLKHQGLHTTKVIVTPN